MVFVAVGMSIPLDVVSRSSHCADDRGAVGAKIGVLDPDWLIYSIEWSRSATVALSLAQGWEFGFVLFAQARQLDILPA